jgi:hypothetical protein
MEYPKIETIFERDEKFKVIPTKIRKSVYELIKTWQWTEKINGTNIRIILNQDGNLTIGGRTDNAQIHADLFNYLQKTFSLDLMKGIFWVKEPCNVILYGEGYGAGIQKGGGNYSSSKVFRLFDVLVERWWLSWENVCDVANKLNIKTVPFLYEMNIEDAVLFTKTGFKSLVALEETGVEYQAEGVVGRTKETLFDKNMKRLIVKLKTKDFL